MNTTTFFSSEGDLWRTPTDFYFDWLKPRFDFTLDAAASDNTLAPHFINEEMDALKTPWHGRVFCNPPYSMAEAFVKRAIDQALNNPRVEGVCLLVPARTDTAWWQDSWMVWNRVEFLRGRLKFWMNESDLAIVNAQRVARGKNPLGASNTAPFPSALLIAGFGLQVQHHATCVDWKRELKTRKVAA
jgi:phage N-6-adenine-methyltransferase